VSAPQLVHLTWAKPPITGNYRGTTRFNGFTKVKEQARWSIRKAHPKPVERAEVTLHWQINTWHHRDADNLFMTLKAAQDALVAEGILPADDFRHVPAATCRIHAPNGEPAAMWLTLEEIA
jgi:hypothetical protein